MIKAEFPLRPLDAYTAAQLEARSGEVQKNEKEKAEKLSQTYNEKDLRKKALAIIN